VDDRYLPHLDDLSARAYACALLLGRFDGPAIGRDLGVGPDEMARAKSVLCRLRLLHPVPGEPAELVAVDPETASGVLVSDVESRVRRERGQVERIRQELMTLAAWHRDRPVGAGSTVEVVTDRAEVSNRLRLAARQCRTEVMTMQPGGARSRQALSEALPRDIDMLERGVRMRVLYQHTVRPSLATRSYVIAVTQAGAQVRTVLELVDRLVIFDRETAFLPIGRGGERTAGAAIVRQPEVTAFLCRVFEATWADAVPLDASDHGYHEISDDLHRRILIMLANGDKDEVIARRLGVAVRTCRRHISKIADQLGAVSRFQAGVRAAQLGLIPSPTDDPDPD
jgi:DNA-binding CsgD family transcriptional regulator/sugar-specific transcriptional regulator TrmB